MRNAVPVFAPLKHITSSLLILACCGQDIGEEIRRLLSFPCRDGGLGFIDPTSLSNQYQASLTITALLVTKIVQQDNALGCIALIKSARKEVAAKARKATSHDAKQFLQSSSNNIRFCAHLASEKGASSWLTCRPLKAHGFDLSKGDF